MQITLINGFVFLIYGQYNFHPFVGDTMLDAILYICYAVVLSPLICYFFMWVIVVTINKGLVIRCCELHKQNGISVNKTC